MLVNYAVVLNFFADYTIQSGILKGLDIGLGQYRGRRIVGSTVANTIPDPANPAKAIPAPEASAFNYVSGYNTVTATLGYHWRRRGHDVFFNLRLVNLLNNRQIIYASGTALQPFQGDYTSPARTAMPDMLGQLRAPMSWTLEASTRF